MKVKWYAFLVVLMFSAMHAQAAPPSKAQGSGNGNPYKTGGNPFAAINAETTALFASVATLEERVTLAEQNIVDLQNKAAELQRQITSNDGDIAALQNELALTLGKISQMQLQLDQLAELLALKQNVVTGTCPPGHFLTAINADGSVVCGVDAGTNGLKQVRVVQAEFFRGCWPWETCTTRPEGTVYAKCPADTVVVGGRHFADITLWVASSWIDGNSYAVGAGVWPLTYLLGGWAVSEAVCVGLK